MKKLLVGVAMLAALAPVPAQANGATFLGGCNFVATNDQTPDGQLGGPFVWNGVVYLDVVTTDSSGLPTAETVSASCELRIDGNSQGTVLGYATGTGAVFDAAQLQYTAYPGQSVTWCVHVGWYPWWDREVVCGPPIIVAVDGTLVNEAYGRAQAALDLVLGVVNHDVLPLVKPSTCDALKVAAPAVDLVFDRHFLWIDPDRGDVEVRDIRVWDCAPPEGGRHALG